MHAEPGWESADMLCHASTPKGTLTKGFQSQNRQMPSVARLQMLKSAKVQSTSKDDGTQHWNQAAFFCGTFFPFRRASERPMAIACFLLLTVFPLRPDFNLPRLNSCISRLTSLPALGLYLRRPLDFFLPLEEERRRELDELRLRELERCFVGILKLCLLLSSSNVEIRAFAAKVGAMCGVFVSGIIHPEAWRSGLNPNGTKGMKDLDERGQVGQIARCS